MIAIKSNNRPSGDHIGYTPRAMDVTRAYWLAMLAASALGTNLGDLWGEVVLHGLFSSLASLILICVVAVWYDRFTAQRTEVGYWIAVVAMRAAATNLADIITHELKMGYISASILLAAITLIAAFTTTPDRSRGNSPRVDTVYWAAMFAAGLFGTVAGDFIHHNLGLYPASAILCVCLSALILVRETWGPVSTLLFWSIVMVERLAGTAVGDALASRAVALDLPLATTLTFGVTLVCILWRARLVHAAASLTSVRAK